ncbi:MAG: hypothetical protein JNN30_00080 [Rhodanobacteraceae bacterium]|nr:hypothetical protein [Rhodanobacteraceae bacterium]
MSLGPYLHAKGFKIYNEYWPEITDGYNGDTLEIYSPAGGYSVRFRYTAATGSLYRGSWDSATGTYDPRYGIITGNIPIEPPGIGLPVNGWFSIALDRALPQPPALPIIHVFVKSPVGGAPDEGSYTGQGN